MNDLNLDENDLLEELEEIQDKLETYNDKTCGCSSFCHDCLGMSWNDFL